MTENKNVVLSLNDVDNALCLLQDVIKTRYGNDCDTDVIMERFLASSPKLQESIQSFVKELLHLSSEGVSLEKVKELCDDNNIDPHLFEVLLGDEPAV